MINEKGYLNGDLLNGEDMTNVLTDSHNLILKQVPDTSGSYVNIKDNGSAIYQLGRSKIYLFINSHPLVKQLYLISSYDGNWVEIVTQEKNAISFTFNSSNMRLTIKALTYCRGYLYELVGIKC